MDIGKLLNDSKEIKTRGVFIKTKYTFSKHKFNGLPVLLINKPKKKFDIKFVTKQNNKKQKNKPLI